MTLDDETDRLLVRISTTLWGAHGSNGLNAEVKHQREQIGTLHGKTSALGEEIERRLGGIYRMLATMAVSMIVGLVAIIGTLIAMNG
jgi:hypothetical protein